jgi:Pyruvate/2-oxoacid:ferredoxin oxidoreductase delta subunit
MNRREVLKVMGASFAATVMAGIAPRTHAALLKDRAADKKRLVFYFTATGNSLFVARQFSDAPLSIPQELKKEELNYEADEIGFVFPDYAASAPMIVRDFVTKARFNAPFIFSVITFGNAAVNVAEWWDSFSKEKGIENTYINTILMVDNYLPVFDMNQQITIDKRTDENLARIIEDIHARKQFVPTSEMGFFNPEMLKNMQDQHFSMTSDRLLTLKEDRCIQCETCANVCPHRNFSLVDGALRISGKCEFCLACVHNCPQKALALQRERNPEARYRHPDISLNDIIRSNRQ